MKGLPFLISILIALDTFFVVEAQWGIYAFIVQNRANPPTLSYNPCLYPREICMLRHLRSKYAFTNQTMKFTCSWNYYGYDLGSQHTLKVNDQDYATCTLPRDLGSEAITVERVNPIAWTKITHCNGRYMDVEVRVFQETRYKFQCHSRNLNNDGRLSKNFLFIMASPRSSYHSGITFTLAEYISGKPKIRVNTCFKDRSHCPPDGYVYPGQTVEIFCSWPRNFRDYIYERRIWADLSERVIAKCSRLERVGGLFTVRRGADEQTYGVNTINASCSTWYSIRYEYTLPQNLTLQASSTIYCSNQVPGHILPAKPSHQSEGFELKPVEEWLTPNMMCYAIVDNVHLTARCSCINSCDACRRYDLYFYKWSRCVTECHDSFHTGSEFAARVDGPMNSDDTNNLTALCKYVGADGDNYTIGRESYLNAARLTYNIPANSTRLTCSVPPRANLKVPAVVRCSCSWACGQCLSKDFFYDYEKCIDDCRTGLEVWEDAETCYRVGRRDDAMINTPWNSSKQQNADTPCRIFLCNGTSNPEFQTSRIFLLEERKVPATIRIYIAAIVVLVLLAVSILLILIPMYVWSTPEEQIALDSDDEDDV